MGLVAYSIIHQDLNLRGHGRATGAGILHDTWIKPDFTDHLDYQHHVNHSLNANLVHKWIWLHTQKSMGLQSAFVSLPISLPSKESQAKSTSISVEIQQGRA
ncbi:hypothetical protein BVY11_21655 [Pseudomonas amygdali pv. morsprunorum]|nr:hypothetical protein BVY11_21655 [Pseudomonas amygdali pv. morsprunorum]PPS28142.1 hypothetical protein BVY12_25330 [Pseudomonas amygdali pv. morsprunorum]